MRENAIKAAAAGCFGALCIYLGELVIPIVILAVVMLIDYGSGIAKAWITGTVSSRVGIKGIVKKVGYLAVVASSMAVDGIVKYGASVMGVEIGVDFIFALPVIIWLVINECISILENVSACGAPVPEFLLKAIGGVKSKVEGDNSEDN